MIRKSKIVLNTLTTFVLCFSLSVHADERRPSPTPPAFSNTGFSPGVTIRNISDGILDITSRGGRSFKMVKRSLGESILVDGEPQTYITYEVEEVENNDPLGSGVHLGLSTLGHGTGRSTFQQTEIPTGIACDGADQFIEANPGYNFRANGNAFDITSATSFLSRSQLPAECPLPDGDRISIDATCGCVRSQNNAKAFVTELPRDTWSSMSYIPVTPAQATRMCQTVVGAGIVNNFSNLIDKYNHSAVVGELLKASGYQGVDCSAAAMGSQFTETYSMDDSGTGQRKCSVQAVGLVVNQLEKTAKSCMAGATVKQSCPISPIIAESMGSSYTMQRNDEFELLLGLTRALPATDSQEADSQRSALRQRYENYVNSSNISSSLESMIESRVSVVMEDAFGCDPQADGSCPDPASLPDKKRRSVQALIRYISSISDPETKDSFIEMYPVVTGLPSFAEVAGGAELSDENLDQILNHFNGQVAGQCNVAKAELLTSCKQVSSGNLFNLEESARAACADRKLMSQRITGNHLRLNIWKQIFDQQFGSQDRAATQQFMCAAHYNFNGLTEQQDAACEERILENKIAEFQNPESRNNALLGLGHSNTDNYAEVLAAFNSCNPFAPEGQPSQQRNLNDEANPYTQGDSLKAATQMNEERTREVGQMNLGSRLGSSPNTNTNTGSGAGSNYGGPTGIEDIRESTRRELTNNPRQVASAAEDFYNTMDERTIQATTSSFMNDITSRTNSATNTVQRQDEIDSENAREELDTVQRSLRANDALLRQLADLEERNNELKSRLEEMNISTIEDSDGNTVSVADAFNRTKQRIEQQRAQAMQEREALAERERIAQSFVNPSNSRDRLVDESTNRNFASNSDSSNNINSRISGTSSSGGSSNVNSGNFNAPSVTSGSTGGSSFDSANYGPVPYSGITLSVDDLSIAKPQLDLGGRSLTESADLVRAAISEVQSVFRDRDSSLPAYTIDGKSITEYIVQEQDGRDVIVYLDGDEVKVQPIDLATTQAVATEETEVVEEEVVDSAPASVTPVIESAGRKDIDALNYSWDFVEQTLDESQNAD